MTQGARRLVVRTLHDLAALLHDPDQAVRLAVLGSLASDPAKAMAFGRVQDQDAVDLLRQHATEVTGSAERLTVLSTLARFRDPRVDRLFEDLLLHADDDQRILLAADYLQSSAAPHRRERLGKALRDNGNLTRARAAADLLVSGTGLPLADRIRIAALATDAPLDDLELDADTVGAWLSELAGPYAPECQTLLERLGTASYPVLLAAWPALTASIRVWLIEWGMRSAVDGVAPAATLGLADTDAGVLAAALTAIRATDPGGADEHAPRITALATHAEPRVRLAAIATGQVATPPADLLAAETDPRVRAACIRQLAGTQGRQALPLLVDCLASSRWTDRAAATDALIDLGVDGLECATLLLEHAELSVRTAAARVVAAHLPASTG